MTTLDELQHWFQTQCNGDWEHSGGITIQSTDNPGWWVTIDLRNTTAAGKAFTPVLRGDHASLDPQPPWLACQMPTLYVREIPEKVYRQARRIAQTQGRSLSAYVLTVLEQAIAAQCGHILFLLSFFDAYEQGQTPAPDWEGSWSTRVVDEAAWAALRQELQSTYDRVVTWARFGNCSPWSRRNRAAAMTSPHPTHHLKFGLVPFKNASQTAKTT